MKVSIKSESTMTERFTKLIQEGIQKWQEAGEVVVKMIDELGKSCDDIAKSSGLNRRIVERFEQLGRKQVMPYLLMSDFPATKHLIKLPYSDQTRLENGTVDMLIDKLGGGVDSIKVEVRNLSRDQCLQVFDKNSLREISGQRAYLLEREQVAKRQAVRGIVGSQSVPYFASKGRLNVVAPCVLTRKEILRILEDMEC